MPTSPETIFRTLERVAPHVHFDVERSVDRDASWDGDGPDPEEEGYVAYQYRVSANTILNGKRVEGDAGLSGTYELPGKHDPDIGGYLPQLLQEAVDELMLRFTHISSKKWPESLTREILDAHAYLKHVMRERHSKQTKRARRK